MSRRFLAVALVLLISRATSAQSFVNWETPHVHPLEMTPDGTRLLAVNTADNRLEVFDLSGGAPVKMAAIPVGLDPVSVRARNNNEAWVVSHVSDSVNIVNLSTLNVVQSLRTDDEPCDVVFALGVNRAFVSCSQANTVLVYDLNNLGNAPARLTIDGEDPRAMAYSAARNEVYVAIFESGNHSTILGGGSTMNNGFPPNVVNSTLSPYFNNSQPFSLGVNPPNPPPNDGTLFKPPQTPGNPTPPRVGMIVKKSATGQWMDDNNKDWTGLVSGANASQSGRPLGWDLYDHDIAVINASTLGIRYADNLMNICMALGINPANGEVTLVGTDATNEVRFEPVLRGRFLRVNLARVNPVPAVPTTLAVSDLNQHLTYGTTIPFVNITQSERNKSIGDPRGIAWNSTGTRGYVAGMGSNNVVIIDAVGNRLATLGDPSKITIDVGEGPTGLQLDNTRQQLYVLNKFAATISTVDLTTEAVAAEVSFHDPSPAAIKIGRKHLYNTHLNSGLGHISCASCHVDGRMDRLAWDLGAPDGAMKPFNAYAANGSCPSGDCQNCPAGGCQSWHPMKGPMTTQTLQDIIGKEPHHWRSDRDGLEEFAAAFQVLLGDDAPLPSGPMQEFEDFLATIYFPPNPFRNFDNTLPSNLPLPGHYTSGRFGPAGQPLPNGNANNGLTAYRTGNLDTANCVTCHTLPTGAGTNAVLNGVTFQQLPPGPNGEMHLANVSQDGSTNITIKIPQLRNEYEKVGMELSQIRGLAGFGVLHDGSVDSLARFVNEPVFNVTSDQMTADLVALMLSFSGSQYAAGGPLEPPGVASKDAHAAVGWQTTLISAATPEPGQLALISNMIAQANTNRVGLVVKGVQNGIQRGYRYNGGNVFQSDRQSETITAAVLQAAAAAGSELTYTIVPKGSETRIGIDRDGDGFFDRDELDQCSDPADASIIPGHPSADIDRDGDKDTDDINEFVQVLLGTPLSPAHVAASDMNCDGFEDGRDVSGFVAAYLAP